MIHHGKREGGLPWPRRFGFETISMRRGETGSPKRLNIVVSNNFEGFKAYLTRQGLDAGRKASIETNYRYIDVLYLQKATGNSLLLSHHFWHDDQECYTLRISRLTLKTGEDLQTVSRPAEDLEALFESRPCLKIGKVKDFPGHEAGGRMAPIGRGSLLLTVGVSGHHGAAQDRESDYGKILKIDLDSKQAEIFSMGHRNPQGLAIDRHGNIWSTEHGPQRRRRAEHN